jgi:Tfp pilus assembly protein PilV
MGDGVERRGTATNEAGVESVVQGARVLRGESGIALFEVLVSALLMVTISLGALGAVDAATRSSAEERHRSEADGLAQQDQARMRSMRISDLANLNQTKTVTQDGTPFSVLSRGNFATDSTGTASCAPGTASADYIKITSTVSWPSMGSRPPVVSESIVSPPNGTVGADHGALAIQVDDASNHGIPGVGLSGSGPGSFSGTTGSTGCAIFGDLPAGNYTLTPSGSSLVDRDGNVPAPQGTSVIGASTNTLALQYDHPGSIPVSFTARVGGSLVPSSADSVMVFNTGMTTPKAFGTVGSPAATVTATSLFPFTSPDTVYAGSCTGDNPNPTNDSNPPGAAAMASVGVPPGGSAPATIQLPALKLTVRSGLSALAPGSPVSGARVTVSDTNCTTGGGAPVKRTFTTNSAGQLPDPGLPYSVYDVCADNGLKHVSATGVSVEDLGNGTSLDLYVGSVTAIPGACP